MKKSNRLTRNCPFGSEIVVYDVKQDRVIHGKFVAWVEHQHKLTAVVNSDGRIALARPYPDAEKPAQE